MRCTVLKVFCYQVVNDETIVQVAMPAIDVRDRYAILGTDTSNATTRH